MSVKCSGLKMLETDENGKKPDPYVCPRRGNCTKHFEQVSDPTEIYNDPPVHVKTATCHEFVHRDQHRYEWAR